VLLFAKASGTETVKLTASFGTTTLTLSEDIATYAQPAAMTRSAAFVPKDIPLPAMVDDYPPNGGLSLYVGASAQVYVKVEFGVVGDPTYFKSWLYPEELSSVEVTGTAVTAQGSSEILAAQIGTSNVTAAFTLPKQGFPQDPYRIEGTSPVPVIADAPVTYLWIKPDWDWGGTNTMYSTMGEPCNLYHLLAMHTVAGTDQYYYKAYAWTEATVALASTTYASFDSSTGALCPISPGATIVEIALGGIEDVLTVETHPAGGAKIPLTVSPSPMVVPSAETAGSCVAFQVAADTGSGAQDITLNPALTVSVQGTAATNYMPPMWLHCGKNSAETGLECCSYGTNPGADPPSTQPGELVVWWAGSAVTVPVSATD
jgi:hypothetical protein